MDSNPCTASRTLTSRKFFDNMPVHIAMLTYSSNILSKTVWLAIFALRAKYSPPEEDTKEENKLQHTRAYRPAHLQKKKIHYNTRGHIVPHIYKRRKYITTHEAILGRTLTKEENTLQHTRPYRAAH